MKQTLIDLFTSKKFLAALTAIIVYAAGRFGFDVDTTVLDRVFQALLVYIGAQGIADAGKGAALVRAAPLSPAAGTPIGTVAVLALVVLGLGAASSLTACTTGQLQQGTAGGLVAALDCEAAHLDAAVLADAEALAAAEIQRWIGGTAPADPDLATLKAKILTDLSPIKSDVGKCAIAAAVAGVAAGARPAGTATSALFAPPAGTDPALLRAAFGGAARDLGWPPVKVAGRGVL